MTPDDQALKRSCLLAQIHTHVCVFNISPTWSVLQYSVFAFKHIIYTILSATFILMFVVLVTITKDNFRMRGKDEGWVQETKKSFSLPLFAAVTAFHDAHSPSSLLTYITPTVKNSWAKTRRKLQTSMFHGHWWKTPQQNTSRVQQHSKDYTSQPSEVYFQNAKMIKHIKINQYNTPHQ